MTLSEFIELHSSLIAPLGGALLVLTYLAQQVRRHLQFDTAKKLRGPKMHYKDAGVSYPGFMAFCNKAGEYFHGCRTARFKNIQDINRFFSPEGPGWCNVVAELIPYPDGSIIAVFTAKLTDRDRENVDEFSRMQNQYFAEKNREDDEKKLEAQKQEIREQEEIKRLAEVGRKVEARKAKILSLVPGSSERKDLEKRLAAGEVDE